MPKKFEVDMGEAMLWGQLDDAVRNRDIEKTVSVITALCTHNELDFDEGTVIIT